MKAILKFLLWTLPLLLWDGIRLSFFVLFLSPGFIRFAWYYFVAAKRTSVRYGSQSCRQTMDVYSLKTSPSASSPLLGAPVLVFFTGGAWLIGYKMWGALLARVLSAVGIVVVIPDMRNYPWGAVPFMVEDVYLSVQWTLRNIADFGGDADNIVLAGQSAGGHVVCTTLLRMAMKLQLERATTKENTEREIPRERNNDHVEDDPWSPTSVRGFLSLSAPYNLQAMKQSFGRHGFDPDLVNKIFGCQQEDFDPYRLVSKCLQENRNITEYLPPIRIYHGTADDTAPYDGAIEFSNALKTLTNDRAELVKLSLYQGWSHTDPILEGPMDADHRFHKDLFDSIVEWTDSSSRLCWPAQDPIIQHRLCPKWLIQFGRFCMPF